MATPEYPCTSVRLLSGGNPRIAKADGDTPVQAYVAAMPEWKSDISRRLADLIVRTVPDMRKAVRWNSPWYGVEGEGWFLSYHVFIRYVKVTFLNGASLDPIPPDSRKDPDSRWYDIYEMASTKHRWPNVSANPPPSPAGRTSVRCKSLSLKRRDIRCHACSIPGLRADLC